MASIFEQVLAKAEARKLAPLVIRHFGNARTGYTSEDALNPRWWDNASLWKSPGEPHSDTERAAVSSIHMQCKASTPRIEIVQDTVLTAADMTSLVCEVRDFVLAFTEPVLTYAAYSVDTATPPAAGQGRKPVSLAQLARWFAINRPDMTEAQRIDAIIRETGLSKYTVIDRLAEFESRLEMVYA